MTKSNRTLGALAALLALSACDPRQTTKTLPSSIPGSVTASEVPTRGNPGTPTLRERVRVEASDSMLIKDLQPGSEISLSTRLDLPRPTRAYTHNSVDGGHCKVEFINADVVIIGGHFYQAAKPDSENPYDDSHYVDLLSGNTLTRAQIPLETEALARWAPTEMQIAAETTYNIRELTLAAHSNSIFFDLRKQIIPCEDMSLRDELVIRFPEATYHRASLNELTIADLKSILGDGIKVYVYNFSTK